MAAPNGSAQAIPPRVKWQGINMLLTLATSLNNDGHSTLVPSCGNTQHLLPNMLVDQHGQARIPNAIATLLIRNAEEVAVTNLQSPGDYVIMILNGRSGDPDEAKGDIGCGDEKLLVEQVAGLNAFKHGFATFTNAYAKEQYFSDKRNLRVRIVPPGKSHWLDISSSQSPFDVFKLSIPKNDPLENHIATIGRFIDEYRKLNEEARRQSFWKMSAYLSLVSWRKMFRRIDNWTSKGYIYLLCSIPFEQLRNGFRRTKDRKSKGRKSNEGFHGMLSSFCGNEEAVKRLLNFLNHLRHPSLTSEEKPKNLMKLLTAIAKEVEKPGRTDPESAYNNDTCIEFHCLLLALLVGYGWSLTKYSKERETLSQEQVQKLAFDIWEYGRFLWAVSLSQMFDDHILVLLQTTMQRSTVSPEDGRSYSDSVVFGDLPVSETVQGHSDVDSCGLERAFGEKIEANSHRDGGPNEGEGESNRDGGVDLDKDLLVGYEEDVEEDQRKAMSTILTKSRAPDYSTVMLFQHWIRTTTSYFAALRLLTKAARDHTLTIGTTIIAANRVGGSSQLDWHDIIRDLSHADGGQSLANGMSPCVPDGTANSPVYPSAQSAASGDPPFPAFTKDQAEKAIERLQSSIDLGQYDLKIMSSFGRSHPGSTIPVGRVQWKGHPHCEVEAVALYKFYTTGGRIKRQSELFKFISLNYLKDVAVSKLCCPVCWELLQVLGCKTPDFQVCGYHTSFYPVELPTLLPDGIVEEMVSRFREHLRRELVKFTSQL